MKKCELWLGTLSGNFFKWETFDSIVDCKHYIKECVRCYHEIRPVAKKQ